MIGIVDYGMGNRRSVEKAFERVGGGPRLDRRSPTLRVAAGADGLGGAGRGRDARRPCGGCARRAGRDRSCASTAAGGVPVIGLCLGMQLLFERSSEHGGATGLGLLPERSCASTRRG